MDLLREAANYLNACDCDEYLAALTIDELHLAENSTNDIMRRCDNAERTLEKISKVRYSDPAISDKTVEYRDFRLELTNKGQVVAFCCNPEATWASGLFGDGTNRHYCDTYITVDLPKKAKIIDISMSPNHCLALSKKGEVYAWGGNSKRQLGNNHDPYADLPVRVDTPDGVKMTKVVANLNYSLALSKKGEIYVWGSETPFGGSKSPFDDIQYYMPSKVSLPEGVKIIDVVSGLNHVLALSDDNQLYAWYTHAPKRTVNLRLPMGEKIKAIDSGEEHCVILCESGNVYTWGSNAAGQLGDPERKDFKGLAKVELPTTENHEIFEESDPLCVEKIMSIAAGRYNTIALSNWHHIYFWGAEDSAAFEDRKDGEDFTPISPKFATDDLVREFTDGGPFSQAQSKSEMYTWKGATGKDDEYWEIHVR